MLRKLRERIHKEEKGFSLIELLVVIVIIGILAAIALPAFLGQQAKGQDSDAKSNARNMVSQVESCHAQKRSYTNCTTAAQLGNTGLTIGTSGGEVSIAATGSGADAGKGYTIVGTSRSGNTFTISKSATTGTNSRSCTSGGSADGGCNGTSW